VIGGDFGAVRPGLQVDHPRQRGPGDDRVVERQITADFAAVALRVNVESHAGFDPKTACQHAFQGREEFVERNFGQITERPEIHAENRNRAFTDRAHDGEQRAVTPEDDHQIDFVGEFAARHAGQTRSIRGLRSEQQFDAPALQPFRDIPHHRSESRLVGFERYTDRSDGHGHSLWDARELSHVASIPACPPTIP